MTCTGSTPVLFNGNAPTLASQSFNWKTWTCTDVAGPSTPQLELISDSSGRSFYLDKTINYGQYINTIMLLIFFVLASLAVLYTLIFRRKY